MVKIEKNIPLPEINKGESNCLFKQLEIGDSFEIELNSTQYSMNMQLRSYDINNDGTDRFIESHISDDRKKIRFWRISVERYLQKFEEEKICLDYVFDFIRDRPRTPRDICRTMSDDPRAGTRALRGKVLKKYAFMFNIKKQQKRGGGYEYSLK